jgi:hypothetical protein
VGVPGGDLPSARARHDHRHDLADDLDLDLEQKLDHDVGNDQEHQEEEEEEEEQLEQERDDRVHAWIQPGEFRIAAGLGARGWSWSPWS